MARQPLAGGRSPGGAEPVKPSDSRARAARQPKARVAAAARHAPCRAGPSNGRWALDETDWLQWPAMASTVAASWLVASNHAGRRKAGFWVFLLSNALWVAWGLGAGAPALIVLQVCLVVLNIRGARKAEAARRDGAA